MKLTLLDRAINRIAPKAGAHRMAARQALAEMTAYYDAVGTGKRTGSWRVSRGDANASGSRRARLAFITRDMIRNNPIATGAVQTIVSHTVGKGIQPKIEGLSDKLKQKAKARLDECLLQGLVDWRGRETLAGLQRLAMASIASDGEVLVIWHPGTHGPFFQLEVLEIDHLDSGAVRAETDGGYVQDGIEYDASGKRVAYHLFDEHPGAQGIVNWRSRAQSRRVPAEYVLHLYRQDRPGQERGVSWFAPVALPLQDLADYEDAQLVRQKIASCFTVFRHVSSPGAPPPSLSPGAIVDVGEEGSYEFASPPGVDGYDEFTRGQLARIARGLGLTYEALSGDMRRVNFSSAKMGRLEMDRNVEAWQWLLLIDQFLAPVGRLFLQSLALDMPQFHQEFLAAKIVWVPPARILVDPSREIPPMIEECRAGLNSRQRATAALGRDPDQILEEQIEDKNAADEANLIFASDGRYAASPAPPVAHTEKRELDDNE